VLGQATGARPAEASALIWIADWTGFDWTGFDWTGFDWTGLDRGLDGGKRPKDASPAGWLAGELIGWLIGALIGWGPSWPAGWLALPQQLSSK